MGLCEFTSTSLLYFFICSMSCVLIFLPCVFEINLSLLVPCFPFCSLVSHGNVSWSGRAAPGIATGVCGLSVRCLSASKPRPWESQVPGTLLVRPPPPPTYCAMISVHFNLARSLLRFLLFRRPSSTYESRKNSAANRRAPGPVLASAIHTLTAFPTLRSLLSAPCAVLRQIQEISFNLQICHSEHMNYDCLKKTWSYHDLTKYNGFNSLIPIR